MRSRDFIPGTPVRYKEKQSHLPKITWLRPGIEPHPHIFLTQGYIFIDFREKEEVAGRERNFDVRDIDQLPHLRAPTWD